MPLPEARPSTSRLASPARCESWFPRRQLARPLLRAKTDGLSPDAIAELDLPAIRDLLGYAMAAAAVTVSHNGADLPTEADVEAGLAAPIRIMSGDGMTVLGKCPLV